MLPYFIFLTLLFLISLTLGLLGLTITKPPLCVCVQHCGVSVVEVFLLFSWHLKLPICLLKLGICCTYILVNAVYPLSFGSTLDFFPLHSLHSSLAHYVAHGGLKLILLIQSSEC